MGDMENDPGWQYLKVSQAQAVKDSTKPYDSKKNVWIPDPEEGFVAAEITGVKGDMVNLTTVKGIEQTVKKEQVQEINPPKFEKTEDMANLTFLNEASVLHNLRQRYYAMMIYTYSGLFCVVINPYKRLPIYTESVIKFYMGKRRNEAPPHLFAVADEAYRNMVFDKENQSMLITGESGAGKTENTKKVIAYLAIVGATTQQGAKKESTGKKHGTLEEQIVQTNPVLEAFGNAKTVRNNNSSRFGKFIRVHFSGKGKLAGGDIEHYLLEKSRVIKQAPGERCFHIFYQIMSGQLKGLKQNLELNQEMTYYHFQSQAELTIEGVDDKDEMKLTDEAFDIMGFEQEEKDNLYKLCAAIMHMGEMKFKQRPREEQAEIDTSDDAQRACNRFGVNHDEFLKSLLKPRVRVGNEWVNKGQNIDQVHWGVGALAKAIYARMFHWLIKRCNKTLDVASDDRKFFIGVLDIAGFEIFDFNSFEQLWINFVNERLQQFFNHHMFVLEQEEYQREGIRWEFIDFGLDLQACIELLEKPLGLVSILDEECIVPKATDMTFVQKLSDQHTGKHPNFQRPKPPKGKQAEAHIAIVHYAGTVRYNCNNWLEKNKDPLNDTAVSVLKSAQGNQLLLDIWEDYMTQEEAAEAAKDGTAKRKGKSASFMTVSMMYRESLSNLMSMLNKTHPHFIRCIIPNELKQSGVIDASLVLNQLTCNGVLEGIRICRKGFPNRVLYADFKQRYAILASDEAAASGDAKVSSEKMVHRLMNEKNLSEEEHRLGTTKIFFKAGVLARMEDLRDQKLSLIMLGLQARIRHHLAIKETQRRRNQRQHILTLQSNIRSWIELRNWSWFRLYGRVRPLLKNAKDDEEVEKINAKVKELESIIEQEVAAKKVLEQQLGQVTKAKEELKIALEKEKQNLAETTERAEKLAALKVTLEHQLTDLTDKLSVQEDRVNELTKSKRKAEQEIESLHRKVQDSELALKKSEADKVAKDNQIKSLQDEIASQEELAAKLGKERKHQEEVSRKLMDDLQGEDDKVNHLSKVKAKLEQQLDELEDHLEREKRGKQELEKAKRKAEGDLKVAHENIDELNKQRHDLETNVKKKEIEMHALASKLEDEQNLVGKLQRQIKEMQSRIQELEAELEAERQARNKAEKCRSEAQNQLQELVERLDEASGMTAAQIELNKRRESELAKLRRDLEESQMNHEVQLSALRKKHNDAVGEMGDQLDQLQKIKAKTDKDKLQLQHDVEGLTHALDSENKCRQEGDKIIKQLELQLAELQAKSDEQVRQVADLSAVKNRLSNENSELLRQAEDNEQQLSGLSRQKSQLLSQLEESRRNLETETREKHAVVATVKNLEHENQSLHDQLDAENETKADLHRQISKLNAEIQQWKAKFENEGLAKLEEIEEAKRKLMMKVQEVQDAFETATVKNSTLEKLRVKLVGELEDARIDVERVSAYAQMLEKRQRDFDKIIDGWRKKVDDLSAELDASQRDNRNLSAEAFKLRTAQDELLESVESLRRENKNLSQEAKELSDQLAESSRSVHELQKIVRRLEMEKDELQAALDEAESALEAEESKVLRAQVEVAQIRQEIEKRIREKEEEFENTRKQHQRALDSMQVSLEAEAKGRAEALRVKKKLESDINELEVALDHANKAYADAQKNLRLHQEQIRELQLQIEEEQRQRDEVSELLISTEKRCATLQGEKEELLSTIESSDRARRQAEHELNELREHVNDLSAQISSLSASKRKQDAELQVLRSEFDESMNEIKKLDELSKKAMADATKLAEELRQEQEHSMHLERSRKGLEQQLKEMQVRVDEAEQAALRGGKKIIQQLEAKIRSLEQDLDGEQRRHQETDKNLRKVERIAKELEFQLEEQKKNEERVTDIIDKLQLKLKTYKRQLDEMEEVAATNLAKYRQAQQQLDDAEERADVAENSLAKLRARARTCISMAPLPPLLMPSASATVIRSSSVMNASMSRTVNGIQNGNANF